MKTLKTLSVILAASAAVAGMTGLSLAQQAPATPVTVEGVVGTIAWDMQQSLLQLDAANGEKWEISLPASPALLSKGLSAEKLHRGAKVKVQAVRTAAGACAPSCKGSAVEITLTDGGQTYALAPAAGAG